VKILYLEDQEAFADIVRRQFLAEHDVTIVATLAAARAVMELDKFDVLLADYDLPDGKGDAFVGEFHCRFPRCLIIAVSSHEAGNQALLNAGAMASCGKLDFSRIGSLIAKKKAEAE